MGPRLLSSSDVDRSGCHKIFLITLLFRRRPPFVLFGTRFPKRSSLGGERGTLGFPLSYDCFGRPTE